MEGIRKNPNKPARLKHEAEVLIATIDGINKEGENDDNRRAFHENYARLMSVAREQENPTISTASSVSQ